jgi:amino acid permease
MSSDAIGPGGRASTTACVASLANTIIGAGILGLPYAFMHCGLVLGLVLIASCATACCTSLHLLALSARTSNAFPSSFYTVANASIPNWAFAIDLAVAIKCFGVATSYLIVAGDLMPTVMAQMHAPDRWQVRELWVTIAVMVAGPLACASRLEVLKLSSLLAICCVCYLAVLSLVVLAEPQLACNGSDPTGSCRGPPSARPDGSTLQVISVFVFSFTCQQNLFAMVNELHAPKLERVNRVILTAVFLALSLYLVVAVSGYLVYGSKVRPDLLTNYPTDSTPFLAARVGVSIVVMCAYPLQAHPSRKCALTLLRAASAACARQRARWCASAEARALDEKLNEGPGDEMLRPGAKLSVLLPLSGEHAEDAEAGSPRDAHDTASLLPTEPRPARKAPSDDYTLRYWLFTAAFILASWRIALAVDNLGKVMAVVGATGSTSVSYILPGAIYWKLHPYPHLKRYVALAMLCIGICIVPVALHAIFTR